MESEFVILNGCLIPSEDAHISAQSRAVAYGDGCFTTLRSYQNRYLHFNEHIERLKNGLQYLGINLRLDKNEILAQVKQLIQKNELSESSAVVRIQCFRKGGRGYSNISAEGEYLISCDRITEITNSVHLSTVSVRAIPNQCLSRAFKLSNSINYIKAAQEAKVQHADDALMLTINDKVSETTISNIFWINDDTIFTPSTECDLLAGIMRNIIIEIVQNEESIKVEEGVFNLDDILNSEAVFCSNSVREIYTVHKINDSFFKIDHPIFLKLKSIFEDFKTHQIK